MSLADKTMDDYIWFLCDNSIPWDDDGIRELRNGDAEKLQEQIISDLYLRGIKPNYLEGSVDERVQKVKTILALHSGRAIISA
jgi:nicotinamide riboside kinase